MEFFLDNFNWMVVNVGLALLGVLFCNLFLRSRSVFLKAIFFILWVLFVPNTIYLITDIQHLPKQFSESDVLFKSFLAIQYLTLILLGVITYIASVYPIEVFFDKDKKNRQYTNLFIFLFNFLIAFAVALGKIQRTHSWYIFEDPKRVFNDFYASSSSNLIMLFVIVFGLVLNVLYFTVIRSFKNELRKFFKSWT